MIKNILLLTISIISSFSSFSQSTYHKMLKEDTTTWQHFGVTFGVEPNRPQVTLPQVAQNSYAAIDTITLNGSIYKKLYVLDQNFGSLNYTNKLLRGYLREDTLSKRVFYRETTTSADVLLYDFSKNVGDSISLTFQSYSQFNGFYRVDSIVTKNVFGGPRKHFYFRKHIGNSNPTVNYFEIIEGVGSSYHIVYIFTHNFFNWQFPTSAACKPIWAYGLSCKHDDQTKKYQSCIMTNTNVSSFLLIVQDSCNFSYHVPGGLKSNNLDRLIKIGPNPTNDKFEVSIMQSFENINCLVTDMAGKIILSPTKESMSLNKNSFSFSTKDLAQGVYIIQVNLNGTLIKRPIIVQH